MTCNVAYMHFCYGLLASPRPATFVRVDEVDAQVPTPPPSPWEETLHDHDYSIDITIRSQLDPGSTGVVHIGTMEVVWYFLPSLLHTAYIS
jgi:hypothetical protein